MTQRERQLLEWIRENPMISQQELADKAGITRSSKSTNSDIDVMSRTPAAWRRRSAASGATSPTTSACSARRSRW